jgi:hypothetical protein
MEHHLLVCFVSLPKERKKLPLPAVHDFQCTRGGRLGPSIALEE